MLRSASAPALRFLREKFLKNPTTGEGIRMQHREFSLPVDLARRHGWQPAEGRDYTRDGRFLRRSRWQGGPLVYFD